MYSKTYEEDDVLSGLRDLFKFMSYETDEIKDFYLEELREIAAVLDLNEFEFGEYMERPLYDQEPDWEDYQVYV